MMAALCARLKLLVSSLRPCHHPRPTGAFLAKRKCERCGAWLWEEIR